jgi:hypothetical protein
MSRLKSRHFWLPNGQRFNHILPVRTSHIRFLAGLLVLVLTTGVYYARFSIHQPAYQVCEYATPDLQLQLYNDILIELVEQHFYLLYLGMPVNNEIDKARLQVGNDTTKWAKIERKIIFEQNKLFGHPEEFSTIYLDTALRNPISEWRQLANTDWMDYNHTIKTFIDEYAPHQQEIIARLRSCQRTYTADQFQGCTFRIESVQKRKRLLDGIGTVRLSNVYLNENQTSGLLYYEFLCGPRCSKGEVLIAERVNGRWKIKSIHQLWIS